MSSLFDKQQQRQQPPVLHSVQQLVKAQFKRLVPASNITPIALSSNSFPAHCFALWKPTQVSRLSTTPTSLVACPSSIPKKTLCSQVVTRLDRLAVKPWAPNHGSWQAVECLSVDEPPQLTRPPLSLVSPGLLPGPLRITGPAGIVQAHGILMVDPCPQVPPFAWEI